MRNEAAWKLWYAENEPEEVPVPNFEGRLAADPSVGAFYRLLLVRYGSAVWWARFFVRRDEADPGRCNLAVDALDIFFRVSSG